MEEVPKEDLRLRSLIENLARENLLDWERDDAIVKEWATKRWRTVNELAHAIGISQNTVERAIAAQEIRRTESFPRGHAPSSFLLGETARLYREDKDAARTIWKAAEVGTISGAHVIAGTKTHIIPRVIVTDGNGADCPQFPPLVNGTVGAGFVMEEIYADKG